MMKGALFGGVNAAVLTAMNTDLSTSPESGFVKTLSVQRRSARAGCGTACDLPHGLPQLRHPPALARFGRRQVRALRSPARGGRVCLLFNEPPRLRASSGV